MSSFSDIARGLDYEFLVGVIEPTLDEQERELLRALYFAPARGYRASELAALLGLGHNIVVNGLIGRVGRKFANTAELEPTKRKGGGNRWWPFVVDGEKRSGGFYWTMLPSLREALGGSEIFVDDSRSFLDELEVLHEGKILDNNRRSYERNPLARTRCIEHYGPTCSVCDLDFGCRYGPVADGLIQVHHLRPLSADSGKRRTVDPIRDLRPVCANCHLVIHRRNPPFTIEEVREFLER